MSRFPRAREHATVFTLYLLLAVGLSWPLVTHFTTRLLGDVVYDERHSMWILWHYKEALFGRQPLFEADLLFYPHGISTLVDGVGPVSALLALPFWPLGPVAAYNGATLLGLALSGYCMYLLVRVASQPPRASTRPGPASTTAAPPRPSAAAITPSGVFGLGQLDAVCAFFAGAAFMAWPIHLVGLYGHIEKVFVGLLPLSVLAGLLALDPARARRWIVAPGVMLLLCILHNGNQFMFAMLALAIVGVLSFVVQPPRRWIAIALRGAAAAILALIICWPLLVRIDHLLKDPNIQTSASLAAPHYTPDVAQLVLPSIHQALLGRLVYPEYDKVLFDFTRGSWIPWLNPKPTWQGGGIETAATIPIVVIGLALAALIARRAGVWAWLAFSVTFVVLTLGPFLRLFGRTTFTVFELPIVLPFAYLASKPGFGVMRTPGRFMMIGSVGLALLAAMGLAWAMQRWPRRARTIAIVATALVLIETWPRPWPQQLPVPVPAFYTRIAQDPERYAVLDLPPARWRPDVASMYMFYQLTHRKPILWSYLSRQYVRFPIDGVRGILDGNQPDEAGAVAIRARLLALGYRFVVWHKHVGELSAIRRPEYVGDGGWRRPPADPQEHAFIRDAFAGEPPIVDDELVTVFRLDRADAR